jgi:hypothetical protein
VKVLAVNFQEEFRLERKTSYRQLDRASEAELEANEGTKAQMSFRTRDPRASQLKRLLPSNMTYQEHGSFQAPRGVSSDRWVRFARRQLIESGFKTMFPSVFEASVRLLPGKNAERMMEMRLKCVLRQEETLGRKGQGRRVNVDSAPARARNNRRVGLEGERGDEAQTRR